MKPQKIVLVSHNDEEGGAAIVTLRLMHALRAKGHDACMLVVNKTGNDPHVFTLGNPLQRRWAFLDERLGIYRHNGHSRQTLFKVSTASTGISLHRNKLVRQADVVMLNWVNQGTVSLHGLKRLCAMGKKVIWTMHDMWCMTGICHHAIDCTGYRQECGNCQYLGPKSGPNDLSHRVWEKKHALLTRLPIKYVAVSNWLRNKGRESTMLRNKHIDVIPNAFPIDEFTTTPDQPLNHPIMKYFSNVICFGAQRLDDPIKGLGYAIDALNIIVDEDPEVASHCVAVFFGRITNEEIFQDLRFPHVILGSISDRNVIHRLYCASKVVLSTSVYESLPGTLIEGQAAGAIPVTFGNGGQADIIEHGVNGYIARFPDTHDIANGIKWALKADISREMLHESVAEKFSADVVADRYLQLIEDFNVTKS